MGKGIILIFFIVFFICVSSYAIYMGVNELLHFEEEEYNKCIKDCESLDLEYGTVTFGEFRWQKQCICKTDDGDIQPIW